MILFHESAGVELVEAADWYESRELGLGTRFLEEVETTTGRIAQFPRMGRRWDNAGLPATIEVRHLPVMSFPYLVVYTFTPRPLVIAVAHGHRRPGYWRDRIQHG